MAVKPQRGGDCKMGMCSFLYIKILEDQCCLNIKGKRGPSLGVMKFP